MTDIVLVGTSHLLPQSVQKSTSLPGSWLVPPLSHSSVLLQGPPHTVCVPSLANNHHHATCSQHRSPPDKPLWHLMCLALSFNGHPISFHLVPTLQTSSTTVENLAPLLKVTVKQYKCNFVAQRHFFQLMFLLLQMLLFSLACLFLILLIPFSYASTQSQDYYQSSI